MHPQFILPTMFSSSSSLSKFCFLCQNSCLRVLCWMHTLKYETYENFSNDGSKFFEGIHIYFVQFVLPLCCQPNVTQKRSVHTPWHSCNKNDEKLYTGENAHLQRSILTLYIRQVDSATWNSTRSLLKCSAQRNARLVFSYSSRRSQNGQICASHLPAHANFAAFERASSGGSLALRKRRTLEHYTGKWNTITRNGDSCTVHAKFNFQYLFIRIPFMHTLFSGEMKPPESFVGENAGSIARRPLDTGISIHAGERAGPIRL